MPKWWRVIRPLIGPYCLFAAATAAAMTPFSHGPAALTASLSFALAGAIALRWTP